MASDDFSGTTNQELTNYNSDWSYLTGVNNEDFQINASGQVGVLSTPYDWSAVIHTSTEDSCEMDFIGTGSTDDLNKRRVFVRADDARTGSEKYGYSALLNTGGTAIYLYIAGTYATETAVTVSTSDTYNIRIVASGTSTVNLLVYLDDVEVIDYDDTSGTYTSGHPGFACGEDGGNVDNTLFDNWTDGASSASIIPQATHHYRANSR